MTWIMTILCPIVFMFIIDDIPWTQYFTDPQASFIALKRKVLSLAPADILILVSGFAGALCAGFVIRTLRAKGYQMF
jgi:hypothetical protein